MIFHKSLFDLKRDKLGSVIVDPSVLVESNNPDLDYDEYRQCVNRNVIINPTKLQAKNFFG